MDVAFDEAGDDEGVAEIDRLGAAAGVSAGSSAAMRPSLTAM